MKVSILMPVYNREAFVEYAIESVLKQTYLNIELIIINDGSTDNTVEIIERYQANYPKLIKVIHQENQGQSIARNNGINNATGEYIAFLDSDDIYQPNIIETLLSLYKQNPEAAFVYSGYKEIDISGEVIKSVYPNQESNDEIYSNLWLSQLNIWAGTMMTTTDNLKQIGGFSTSLRGAENHELRLNLSKLGPIYFSKLLLSNYRKHPDNSIRNYKSGDNNYLRIVKKHLGEHGELNHSLWKKVMANFYFKLGMRFFGANQYKPAINNFVLSIKHNPRKIQAYAQLFRSLLGKKINQLISNYKKKKPENNSI
ncbi:glycosyltransferase family 2 protein [Thalassomonas sp. M1454]|uniref:glycosyltransferase family 2 protein n=1 Tax=Thalassomonas sp. M1454 TaxID=2594477 RepID=UPI00117E457F|nr:glycosyltransferase family 2 protein [Thalassomonas sp. M1454]TRX57940.1 glycosyltransferase family 2 protein [Thalassomonas sp. M1454]